MILIFLRSLDFTGPWQAFRRERYLMILEEMVENRDNACYYDILTEFFYYFHDEWIGYPGKNTCCFSIRICMIEIIIENNLLSGVKVK
jgi:hypothetical protein